MDLLKLGAQLLNEKLGLDLDPGTIQSALSSLMGDGKGGIDLQGLVGKMTSGGALGSLVNSWLGDGGNLPISADAVTDLFGKSKLDEFAGRIGVGTSEAAGGLAGMLPDLIDKSSSGGNLLESVGGLGGLMGAAKSFLK